MKSGLKPGIMPWGAVGYDGNSYNMYCKSQIFSVKHVYIFANGYKNVVYNEISSFNDVRQQYIVLNADGNPPPPPPPTSQKNHF